MSMGNLQRASLKYFIRAGTNGFAREGSAIPVLAAFDLVEMFTYGHNGAAAAP